MRTVVLGAGIAGLTAAFRRKGEGELTVLEASPRVGGSILTLREDGFAFEGGPNTLRTTPAADRLLADLGLEPEVVAANAMAPRWIVRGGRSRAIVPGPQGLFTSALTFGEKLRVLGERNVPRRSESLGDESVHDFFLRRFGEGVARYAAGPIVSGVYADDPRTLSMRTAFPRLWVAEERSGSVIRDFLGGARKAGVPKAPRYRTRTLNFRRGLVTLPEALAERVTARGGRVLTGQAAVELEGPLSAGAPWRVRTSAGEVLEADVLLSSVEAPTLSRLLAHRLPRSGSRLAALRYSAMAVVVQVFRVGKASDAPQGFGVLIPRGEGFRALGVLYPSSLFPGRIPEGLAITTSFLGGALEPELAAQGDDELSRLAEEEARRLHPRLGERARVRLFRWAAAIPRLPLGHHDTLGLLQQDLEELNRAAGREALLVTGPWRDGVAMGDRIERGEALGSLV